jgi:hypothetical protein
MWRTKLFIYSLTICGICLCVHIRQTYWKKPCWHRSLVLKLLWNYSEIISKHMIEDRNIKPHRVQVLLPTKHTPKVHFFMKRNYFDFWVLLETEVLIVTLFPFSFQKGPNKYFETKNPTISVFIFFKKKKKKKTT